jgi:peptidoglycan/LPS O-acetylase OafA/YrhL
MEDPETRGGRSEELNGLRGLAAISVVFCHFFSLFPPSRWTLFWKISPLSLFTSGRGSVVIFFVLSGFALHRMTLKTVPFRYHEFALRRITRIFGPYLIALALALAGNFWLSRGIRPDFSDWFNQTWPVPISRTAVWQHVAFLGEYDTKPFNCAFWSLVHETRISLVFPFLLAIVKGKSALWSSYAVLFLFTFGSLLKANIPSPNNLGESLHYSGLFVTGIYISQHQRSLAIWFRSQGGTLQKLFTGSALALFCYGRFASHLLPYGYGEFQDIPVGLAAAALVVVAFSWAPFSAFLVSKPTDWLGTRSYSLYLVHGTVLFALVNLLNLSRPNLLLLPLYVTLALFATELFYLTIERPLVLLSRKFTPKAPPTVSTAAISTPVQPPPAKSYRHQ